MPDHNERARSVDSGNSDERVSDADIVACLELLERVWPKPMSVAVAKRTTDEYFQAEHGMHGEANITELTLERFVVKERIGEGGFGIVFLAYDTKLHRDVAIKVPRPHILAQPRGREQFLHEAKAAALLDHPGIVPVHEVIENGVAVYIVSAHCAGRCLASWIDGRGPVEPKEAAWIVAHLTDAVRHAHSRGVLHRDLKPANVLLESASASPDSPSLGFRPKLTDFGLAKIVGSQTKESMEQFGTAHYMSPEQVCGRSKDVGVQCDVFSLGVILYELLAGRRPFEGDALVAMRQIADVEPPSLRLLRPRVPLDLATICHKCLEKNLANRYASAGDLLADLERFERGDAVTARPLSLPQKVWRWTQQRPLLAAMSVAILVSAAAGVSGVAWQWQRANTHREIAEAQAVLAERHLHQAEATLHDFAWLLEEKALWSQESDRLESEAYQRLQGLYDLLVSENRESSLRDPLMAAMESFYARQAVEKGDVATAKQHFDRALSIWRGILVRYPENGAYRRSFALCLHASTMIPSVPQPPDSNPEQEGQSLFGNDPTKPTDVVGLWEYVDLLADLAASYQAMDHYTEAMTALNRAIPIAERLSSQDPSDQNRMHTAQVLLQQSHVWLQMRRRVNAEATLTKALAMLNESAVKSTEQLELETDLLLQLGDLKAESKQQADARSAFDAAVVAIGRLPAGLSRSSRAATAYKALAFFKLAESNHEAALPSLESARAELVSLQNLRPLTDLEKSDWAELSFHCGKAYFDRKQQDAAWSALSAAVNGFDDPSAASRSNRKLRIAAAESNTHLGDLQVDRNDLTGAVASKRKAVDIYQRMFSKRPDDRLAEARISEITKEIDALLVRIKDGKQAMP